MGCCFSNPQQYLDDEHNPSVDKIPHPSKQGYSKNLENSMVIKTEAQQYKKKGNQFFQKKRFREAIQQYKEAISLNSCQATYYTNLALAYRSNKQFYDAIQCINKYHQKLEMGQITNSSEQVFLKSKIIKYKAILHWSRQYCLSDTFDCQQIRIIKKNLNETIISLKDMKHQNQIKNASQNLLPFYKQADEQLLHALKIQEYFNIYVVTRQKNNYLLEYLRNRIKSQRANCSFGQHKIKQLYSNQNQVFSQFQAQEKKNNIFKQEDDAFDDYLLDPISFECFIKPVVLPSGQTYQQAMIKQHFSKNGLNDPLTKQSYIGKLINNEALGVKNRAIEQIIVLKGKKVRKEDLIYMNL